MNFYAWLAAKVFAALGIAVLVAATMGAAQAQPYPDVMLMKSGPETATPDTDITYTVTVTNLGDAGSPGADDATSVTMSDPLPADTTFKSLTSPNGWSCSTPAVGDSGAVSCTIAALSKAAGAQTFNIVAHVAAGTAGGTYLTNIATVSSAADFNDENNSSTSTAQIPAPSVDVGVQKLAAENVTADSDLVYQLTVTASGVPAAITLTDILPLPLTFISLDAPAGWNCTTPAVGSNGTISCSVVNFTAGNAAFTLTTHVPADTPEGTFIQNFASVSALQNDINPENDSSSAATTVQGTADLGISKIGPASAERFEVLSYTVTVNNAGPSSATNTVMTDALTAGLAFSSITSPSGWSCATPAVGSGGTITCSRNEFASGGSASFTIEAEATVDGSITNIATISSSDGDGNISNNSSAATTAVTDTVAQAFEDMTRGFVETRQKLIVNAIDTPGLRDRHGVAPHASLAEANGDAVLNFSARTGSAWDLGPGSALLAGGADAPLSFWIDGTFTFHTRDEADGTLSLIGTGADYLVNDRLLAGVALYLDGMRDVTEIGRISGTGALVGPYISAEILDNVTLDASVFFGHSWNDANATLFGQSFSGSFETDRLITKVDIEGEWRADAFTIRPSANLRYATETVGAYTVTNPRGDVVDVDGFTASTLELGGALTAARTFAFGDGLELTPTVGIRAGVGGTGEDVGIDSTYAGLTAGMTLTGPGWTLRALADHGIDTTGLAATSIRGTMSGRF
ncbi:DUF11 domain-containing protein [Devosia sp. A16]|uniref:DUF11 domain-containing protein n=1 Tax=Devosia sp. A16 TaxID=1736675 RepID=UPI0006D80339|nr:DUF11 domain-containing protein [Devosia sp. A16]